MKPITIRVPIWDTYLHILFLDTHLKARLRRLGVRKRLIREALEDEYVAITFLTKAGESVIVFRKPLPHPRMTGTLGHEIFHAAQDLLEDRGVFLKKGQANEPHAYLVGYLMEEALRKMGRKHKL